MFSFLRFTDNVTKDGDAIKYTINVRKLHEAGDILTFVREYEDLQVDNKNHILENRVSLVLSQFQTIY